MSNASFFTRRKSVSRRLVFIVGGYILIGSVGGCAMFHSTVKGGFLCSAPGGSCAPTSVIDDGALRDIRAREKSDHGGDMVLPTDEPSARGGDVVVPVDGERKGAKVLAGLSGRALRVSYPAHIGSDGRVVPKHIAYALVDLPDWQDVQGPLLTVDGRVANGPSRGLLGAAQAAPDAFALSSSTGAKSVIAPTGPAVAAAAQTQAPGQAPVKTDVVSIDQIKAQAEKILSSAKAHTAGTFSPSGN